MQKRVKKVVSFGQIFLLVSMSIAISVMISWEAGMVSGGPEDIIKGKFEESQSGVGVSTNALAEKGASGATSGGSANGGSVEDYLKLSGGDTSKNPPPINPVGPPQFAKDAAFAEIKSAGGFEGTSITFKAGGAELTGTSAITKSGDTLVKTGGGEIYKVANGVGTKVGSEYTYKAPFGLFETSNFFYGNLMQGVMAAVAVAGLVQLVGNLAGFDKGLTTSLTYSLAGGIMAYKTATGLFGETTGEFGSGGILGNSLSKTNAGLIGLGVAVLIFILTYKTTKKKTVTFQCLPFEPPLGGRQCEECNKYPFKPCSEYRCRALGQACQILNAGTKEEMCAWVGRNDVNSPKIIPDTRALLPTQLSLKYVPNEAIRPPAIGSKIVTSGGGCVPAFTALEFGFTTDEPAQCKIDYNHTNSFKEMVYYVGETNMFGYNHTEKMKLPGPDTGTDGDLSPILRNDGTFNLYVRCQDANGNENVDEYVFSFCVDQSDDTTQPVIEEFSIASGSPVTYNMQTVPIEVYLNEPAECKWSTTSKSYADMENPLRCSTQSFEINSDLQYACKGNLTGIRNRENNLFYFRCKDQPDKPDNKRNTNTQSKELMIRGSEPLYISSITPNASSLIYGSTDVVNLTLRVETTNGADEGVSSCLFSPTGLRDSYIMMFATDNYRHEQDLNLGNGAYKYYIRCLDAGGNAAEGNTTFTVRVDQQPPKVTRAYYQDGLKIVTNEDSECAYSLSTCNFKFEEGVKLIYSNQDNKQNLYAEWSPTAVYHIKCRDGYGNLPLPNECTVVVNAVELKPADALV